MTKICYLDISMKNNKMFELSNKQIEKIQKENLKVRLINDKFIVKSFRDKESISAIVSIAKDNNNKVFVNYLNDVLRTVKNAKYWNNKKMLSIQNRGS